MANVMQLEIVTPDKYFTKRDDVVYAGFMSVDGGFGACANHLPFIAALKSAPLKYRDADNNEYYVFLSGGFAEMKDNKITVLSTNAEAAEDIDAARAQAALERAEDRLKNKRQEIDVKRAEAALARAIGRLKTVEYASKASH